MSARYHMRRRGEDSCTKRLPSCLKPKSRPDVTKAASSAANLGEAKWWPLPQSQRAEQKRADCSKQVVSLRTCRATPRQVLCIAKKAYIWRQVIRKFALSVLALLLVSAQALAATCDLRCSMTESIGIASQMSAPGHDHSMATGMPNQHTAGAKITGAPLCDDHVCPSVWALVQTPAVYCVRGASTPSTLLRYDPIPNRIAIFLRFVTDRSPSPQVTFNPLISSLRV